MAVLVFQQVNENQVVVYCNTFLKDMGSIEQTVLHIASKITCNYS